MLIGGMVAAWVGAGLLAHMPKGRVLTLIAALLVAIAVLLVLETAFAGSTSLILPHDPALRAVAASWWPVLWSAW
jgi:uncharacterized membrane protein YfcA